VYQPERGERGAAQAPERGVDESLLDDAHRCHGEEIAIFSTRCKLGRRTPLVLPARLG
jgi:hypothetical protein